MHVVDRLFVSTRDAVFLHHFVVGISVELIKDLLMNFDKIFGGDSTVDLQT